MSNFYSNCVSTTSYVFDKTFQTNKQINKKIDKFIIKKFTKSKCFDNVLLSTFINALKALWNFPFTSVFN